MASAVKIEGLRELQASFAGLKKASRTRILRAAIGAGARVVRDAAQDLAPIATGKLRANVIASRRRQSKDHDEEWAVTVRTVGKGSNPKNAFYWKFLEFGTRFIAARPFMTPAFEGSKQNALNAVVERYKKRLDAELKKLPKGPRSIR